MRLRVIVVTLFLALLSLILGAKTSFADTPTSCTSSISPASVKKDENFTVVFSVPSLPFDAYCNTSNSNGVPNCIDIKYCQLDSGSNCIKTFSVKEQGGKIDAKKNPDGSYVFSHTKSESTDGSWRFFLFEIGVNDTFYCTNTNTLTIKAEDDKTTFDLCKQATGDREQRACQSCLNGTTLGEKKQGLWTAVGCVPTSPQGIVQSILRIGLGMAGGIVVLSVLAGAFMLATSAGNPKQVEEAQQLISSAIIGLLFVVFSVIILQFIGVQILHIPGFGSAETQQSQQ